jgi:ribokinase
MATEAPRLVVFGTLNVDLIWHVATLPRPGQTVLALATERQFGGKGANQAVAAARQGVAVALVGALGDDGYGAAYREHLAREGIDARAVAGIAGASTGTAHVYVDRQGENLIVVDSGANARVDASTLDAVLPGAAGLLVTLEAGVAAGVEALQRAYAAGVRTLLNASPVCGEFPWGEVPVDTVIVNEHECAEIFGSAPDLLSRAAETERAALLRTRGMRHLVVTRGAQSTVRIAADRTVDEVPTLAVTPRDTVGAGDTFAGALAAQLAEGQPWAEALRHANIAAALSTLARGAQSAMPSRADVEARKRP